jgi:hypothetical protein
VFSEKRLQAIENKGNGRRKERRERTKRLQGDANKELARLRALKAFTKTEGRPLTPGATQINVKTNGLRKRQFVRV